MRCTVASGALAPGSRVAARSRSAPYGGSSALSEEVATVWHDEPMTERLAEVAPGVWVATSRRYATTSTVLLDGQGGALVVDPAWDADELAAIPADLRALGVGCVAGVATHEHYDHVLWHPDLGRVPRWTSSGTAARAAGHREELIAPLEGDIPGDLIDLAARLDPLVGDKIPWDGPSVRVWIHDAHAPAHLALELEESRVLVAGDMLSDIELPMPDSSAPDLVSYLAGLDTLAPIVGRATMLIPGHGTPTEQPMHRLDADRAYLDAILNGRPVDDPRMAYDGMAELHAANVVQAARTASV